MNKHFRFFSSTLQKLEQHGVSASAVLRRTGLPQGYIDQPRVLLNTEELFALWRAIGEVKFHPPAGESNSVQGQHRRGALARNGLSSQYLNVPVPLSELH